LRCTNKTGAPSSTPSSSVTCDVDSSTVVSPCQKSAVGTQCSVYTTTVYRSGKPPITDDPEFIVDNSQATYALAISLGILGLLVVGYVAYRWGKTQGRLAAP